MPDSAIVNRIVRAQQAGMTSPTQAGLPATAYVLDAWADVARDLAHVPDGQVIFTAGDLPEFLDPDYTPWQPLEVDEDDEDDEYDDGEAYAFYSQDQPRDDHGRWVSEGGGGWTAEHDARKKALKVPPGWVDVRLNLDPNAEMQATGMDAKGRKQYIYSAEHREAASADKFERLKRFHEEVGKIRARIAEDLKSKATTREQREAALVLALIDKTGFRIGSDKETGGDKTAYGASTLKANHVKVDGDKVAFRFIAKKGVSVSKTIHDSELAAELAPRVAKGGRLFDTTDDKVRDYLHTLNDGDFKVKDFRTWHGTDRAMRAIEDMPVPKTEKAFKKAQREVVKKVARFLGNTPAVAKASYIDPSVWTPWKAKLAHL